ncbi:tryptophan synthase subunit alpha [Timonella senegalensis]|uniref:tryptophan synthase subunit alpha n=1 Tax=Timonella senegalensis TaxID=1465825 RepID=UPI0028AAD4D1|nr:tryptophan synthase subunit alpha [Timonella senegalensis]
MSQVADKIRDLRDNEGRAALIGYLPVGYPSVEGSIEAARALIEAGADILELGVPYTDPVMDGETIQYAVQEALEGGVRLRDVFTVIRAISDLGAPVLVMTYFNPIFHYGLRRFAQELVEAGGAGLITPDLTPDAAQDWIDVADEFDLDKVFLVAPSSTTERLELTAAASRGFVYAASTMGVTGERATLGSRAEELVGRTREAGAEIVCVGLGVSREEQARDVGRYADGVIVGSAFVRPLSAEGPFDQRLAAMSDVARALAHGVRTARK